MPAGNGNGNSAPVASSASRNGARGIPYGLLAAMSVAGVVLVLAGTYRYGIGVSPDSAGYLCAARSLLAGQGYRSLCHSPYTAWPPLFPTVLAAMGLAGIEPAEGARLLNAVAMGGIILGSGVFLGRCLKSRLLAAIGTCSIVLSFPLLGVFSMAWTEPLFVLLIVLFVLQMSAFLRDRHPSSLVAASILAALCSLQRYTGVTLIGAGAVLILWPGPRAGVASRLRQLVCFLAISSIPLGLWMVRNHRLTGMLTGHPRQHSIYSLRENMITAVDTMTSWFVPENVPLTVRAGVILSLTVLIAGALVLLRRKTGWGSGDGHRGCFRAAGLVVLVYIPLILHTHQVGVLDETMNDRYLAPLAVIVPWLLFVGIDQVIALLRFYPRRGPAMASLVLVFCGLWLYYPLESTHARISHQMRDGAGGYSRAEWRESPLAGWLEAHPLQGAIRSNAPDALYALTGVDAQVSPHRTWDIPAFREVIVSGGGETLVWFGNSPRSYLYDLEELASMLPVEKIVSFPDGGVYRLAAKNVPFGDRAFSPYMVDGAVHRRFTSDTFGPRGLIVSWVLREDGRTDSVWELAMPDGTVIAWNPSCEYARSGDAFEFHCEGRATRTGDGASAPYRLDVHGTIHGDVAAGEYRIEFSGAQWPAADKGWWRIDVARPVYRLYSHQRGIHAYTMSREEATRLAEQPGAPWTREGAVFCVYPEGSQPPDAAPVFRFTSKATGADFYTAGEAERDTLLGNSGTWDYRGVAWYAYSPEPPPSGTGAVHRFWSGVLSAHFYTMDEPEKEKLLSGFSHSWTYEGIVWYALPAGNP